jgi:hypothetical protein
MSAVSMASFIAVVAYTWKRGREAKFGRNERKNAFANEKPRPICVRGLHQSRSDRHAAGLLRFRGHEPDHSDWAERAVRRPPAWLFELRYDGFRGIADTIHGRMLSKNGNRLRRFDRLLDNLPRGCVFNGEIVARTSACAVNYS